MYSYDKENEVFFFTDDLVEYLLKYGQVDVVSARKDLRDTLAKILEAHKGVK